MNIKEIVKDNDTRFLYFRNGVCYYAVTYQDELYSFPVPVEDVGNATLNATHKAITLMRYIRKALDDKTFVKVP